MSERRAELVNGGVIAHNGLKDWILQRDNCCHFGVVYSDFYSEPSCGRVATGLPVGKAYLSHSG